ncbi:hypothetical protein [Sinorhizobium medicae]
MTTLAQDLSETASVRTVTIREATHYVISTGLSGGGAAGSSPK